MPRAKHSYLRTHRLTAKILTFDVAAEGEALQQRAASASTSRAAKTLVKEGRLRATLIALRKGAALGAHSVEGEVTLHVLRGAFEVRTKGAEAVARAGGVIALQAGVRHEARALRDSTVLITTCMR
jgi:quercetin dioxygenase-like cupin family protein